MENMMTKTNLTPIKKTKKKLNTQAVASVEIFADQPVSTCPSTPNARPKIAPISNRTNLLKSIHEEFVQLTVLI